MPYMHKWYIEKQVICARLWGSQTIAELIESNQEITKLLDCAEGRLIHMLIDDRDLVEIPVSLFETRKVLTYARHPNLGWVVMYGANEQSLANSVKDFMLTTLAKLSRARYVRVKTFSEAIDHLKNVDSTIAWNKVDPVLANKCSVNSTEK